MICFCLDSDKDGIFLGSNYSYYKKNVVCNIFIPLENLIIVILIPTALSFIIPTNEKINYLVYLVLVPNYSWFISYRIFAVFYLHFAPGSFLKNITFNGQWPSSLLLFPFLVFQVYVGNSESLSVSLNLLKGKRRRQKIWVCLVLQLSFT